MDLLTFIRKKWLSLATVTVLCVLLVPGYIATQNKKKRISRAKSYPIASKKNMNNKAEALPRIKRIAILNDRSFDFGSFVIPIEQRDNFSYISLKV